MPVTVEVAEADPKIEDLEEVFAYLNWVDQTFSTYKEESQISRINSGLLKPESASPEVVEVLAACEQTKIETKGYFNCYAQGKLDPSGYVKGWAIDNAARILARKGYSHYFVEIGGDIQTAGYNSEGEPWIFGIRNPFKQKEIVKRVSLYNKGLATSGTYIRGQHIYNPHRPEEVLSDVISLSVIGPRITDADRFATAAFAMGREGINFIAGLKGFAGYQIDKDGIATFTREFSNYIL